MILLDTSGLFAAVASEEPRHAEIVAALADERLPFVVSPFVLAELDYFVTSELGVQTELDFLQEVADGALSLPRSR